MFAVSSWYAVAIFIVVVVVVVVAGIAIGNSRSLPIDIVIPDKGPVSPRSGTKKALLIGCNYPGTSYSLNGCINDVNNIADLLRTQGYSDIEILADDGSTPVSPSSEGIVAKMTAAVASLRSGDTYFVWYSGHGAQLRNSSSDGGYDECWCPPDTVPTGRYLRDNVLNGIVKQAVAGSTIFIGSDSCHSGTVFDLGFMVQEKDGKNKNRTLKYSQEVRGRTIIPNRFLQPGADLFTVSPASQAKAELHRLARAAVENPRVLPTMVLVRDAAFSPTTATIVTLSGCQDYSTSADAYENGESQGAMTWAFIRNFQSNQTLSGLLGNMRANLKSAGYPQIPQLAFGTAINPTTTLSSVI